MKHKNNDFFRFSENTKFSKCPYFLNKVKSLTEIGIKTVTLFCMDTVSSDSMPGLANFTKTRIMGQLWPHVNAFCLCLWSKAISLHRLRLRIITINENFLEYNIWNLLCVSLHILSHSKFQLPWTTNS